MSGGVGGVDKPLTELLVRLSLQTVATDTLTATMWWDLHLRMRPPARGLQPSVPALQAWILPLTTFNSLKLHTQTCQSACSHPGLAHHGLEEAHQQL